MSAHATALRWTTSEALIAEGLHLLSIEAARTILSCCYSAYRIANDPLPGDRDPKYPLGEAHRAAQRLLDLAALRRIEAGGILDMATRLALGRYPSQVIADARALLETLSAGGAA